MSKRDNRPESSNFHQSVVALLPSAKQQTVQQINQTLVTTYFQIGRMIVEEEQKGKERATYGKQVIMKLSAVLKKSLAGAFLSVTWSKCARFSWSTQKRRHCLRNSN